LNGVEKGEVKGVDPVAVVEVVGDVKEAGRAGTVGGAVVEVAVVAEVPAGVAVDVVEATAAGAGDVDAAAAAIVLLRSQGFGGEPIAQNQLSRDE
jgi:hypothetical protein